MPDPRLGLGLGLGLGLATLTLTLTITLTLTYEWWQRCGEAVGTGQLARNAQLGLHLVRVRVRG